MKRTIDLNDRQDAGLVAATDQAQVARKAAFDTEQQNKKAALPEDQQKDFKPEEYIPETPEQYLARMTDSYADQYDKVRQQSLIATANSLPLESQQKIAALIESEAAAQKMSAKKKAVAAAPTKADAMAVLMQDRQNRCKEAMKELQTAYIEIGKKFNVDFRMIGITLIPSLQPQIEAVPLD